MRMRIALVLIVVFALLFALGSSAYAENEDEADERTRQQLDEGVDETIDGLELDGLRDVYEGNEVFSGSLEDTIKELSEYGLEKLTAKQALEAVGNAALGALRKKAGIAVQIVVTLLALALLRLMEGNFSSDGAAKAGFWAGYAAACMLAMSILKSTMECARTAIGELSGVVEAVTPLLTALLTGLGGSSGASVMSPLMSALTGTVFVLIERVVFPVILVMTALSMVSNISESLDFTGFVSLGDKLVKWFMGVLFVVFIGLLAVKGIGGAAIDGVYFKTAKYTVEKMVPVVGGMFSDTLDTLTACGVIVRNSIGTVGMVLMAIKLITPVMSIAADIFIFKAAAAVVRPFAPKRCAQMLEAMSSTAELTAVTVLVCSAMAFISLALFIGSADISFMMR